MQSIEENGTCILLLEGDLQGSIVQELDNILKALSVKKIQRVALDMSNVGYIYSRGIGVLVRAQKDFQSDGGALYMFNLKTSLQKILMEINLMDYLNGFGTKEEMEFEFFRTQPTKDEASLELGLYVECLNSTQGMATFNLTGTIDSEFDMDVLKNECEKKITQGIVNITFLLSDLIYIDDRGVHQWKSLRDRLVENNGSLTLSSMNEIIKDQLNIMGMQNQFIIQGD